METELESLQEWLKEAKQGTRTIAVEIVRLDALQESSPYKKAIKKILDATRTDWRMAYFKQSIIESRIKELRENEWR